MTHICISVVKEPEQIFKTQLLTAFFFSLSSGSENSFIQVIFPEKIQANTSNGSEVEDVRDIFCHQYYYMKFLIFIT